ncbi:LacI family DNA-binding transcriptional regulator [Butyricicoccus pullicaecorum]|uniref:HTH lacI-type domain-containing protein n=2 Tax=Butyricicoccus pullicaecorum TaxID=501571 RepID=R8W050_9FIRM|nr:LacI family DNA-binding transcriptional regulator [Butyricicoccus pullicaecorum]EOQ38228.1 hypothetical protein HMPREF1526_01256 [Butyricicoccus pullicaecorum 1.2]OUP54106.1 LacI family transcriptional regulator [Butyricicoccus pullicaecorum]SKA54521.1 transcriptional regulator, LacI family [Butyricicoccus pullicaecorum DSM 23266]
MKRVTIKDIARIAGVSYATISRALSGSSEVSEQTRKRILEICKQEGYRTNALARSLTCSKTNVIGLVVPDITNPFYAELALEIETFARQMHYNVMLCNSIHYENNIGELMDFLISHQVDGIILGSSRNEARACLHEYHKTIPSVLLGASISDEDEYCVNAVSVDNRAGGRMAAEYLLELGHRDITYLGFRPSSITHQLRYHGFLRAMEQRGLTLNVIENPENSSSLQAGYQLGKQLFAQGLTCTAIFAATDSLALGVIQAADEFNIRIPEDVSLLGFDNISYAALPKITLSTIDQRKSALAESAVRLLVSLIEQPSNDGYAHHMIRPALIERHSCAALQLTKPTP